jgi:hypothetical protein
VNSVSVDFYFGSQATPNFTLKKPFGQILEKLTFFVPFELLPEDTDASAPKSLMLSWG